jgi:hypothetical protein
MTRLFFQYSLEKNKSLYERKKTTQNKSTYTYTTEGECIVDARGPRILPCAAETAGNLKGGEGAGELSETRPLREGGGRRVGGGW